MYKKQKKELNSRTLESSNSNKRHLFVTIQLKRDHLFNNIPSAFSRGIPQKHIKNLKNIKENLEKIRNDARYIPEGVYSTGETDVNTIGYSNALATFRELCKAPIIHSQNSYPIVDNLFRNSIDSKVEEHLVGQSPQLRDDINRDKKLWFDYIPSVVRIIGE